MNRLSRLLVVLASLALVGLYFLPLWRVALQAPQYPEGIGMYIDVSNIRGFTEFDLEKINNLNHYIGMKRIDPESIPELRYMPWILGAIIGAGLVVAAVGRRALLKAWLALLLIAAIAGLADFYRWGHDYGHNLAPDAIIKIPGMAYQPPVIGRKQLLNFRADSWPASGGMLAGVAFLLGATALFVGRPRAPRTPRSAVAGAALAVAACGAIGPQPIAYDGTEVCGYCSMAISDSRFGAQVVTGTGRVESFDSIECLAGYVGSNTASQLKGAWVTDYANPGTFIAVDSARFVRVTDGPGSPMGMGLRAHSPETVERGQEVLDWAAVLTLVNERPLAGAHDHGAGG